MDRAERIFLVDDDQHMCRALERALRQAGYEVRSGENSVSLFRAVVEWEPQLVILDVRLGPEDGREIARTLRTMYDLPILMLTGQSSVDDRITGLESGADDYLPKPFDNGELVARIRALLRRSARPLQKAASSGFPIEIDREQRTISTPSGEREPLTELQTCIMVVLMERVGHVVSREEIYSLIFRRPWEPNDRSLEVHISNLRKIVARLEPDRVKIQSVRHVGYRLVITAENEA
ncbi:MAG: response regulator transcription factor [Pseudomonadota bacterium]